MGEEANMRAAVVRDYGLKEFVEGTLDAVGLVQLIVLGDGVAGIDFEAVRSLSALEQCAVVSSGYRRDGDDVYYSAVAAEYGDLVGVADAVHSIGGLSVADTLHAFDFEFGRVGLLVGDDVLYPEAARALAESDVSLYLAVRECTAPAAVAMARSHAVANGIRLLYSASDCGFAADYSGRATKFEGRVVTVDCATVTDKCILSALRKDCCRVGN